MADSRWKHIVFNKNITEQESLDFYTTWSETYDEDQIRLGFKRQYDLAKKLSQYFPDKEQRKQIRILDIAAGTGLVGQGLKIEGFENIEAVDGNKSMLEKLERKSIYKKSLFAILGDKSQVIHEDIKDGSYDVAIIMGGFAQSHLPIESLYQVARTLKPGGIFINLMTKMYLEIVDKLAHLEPLMEQMEGEGIWSKMEVVLDQEEKQGIYHIYKKL